MAGAGDEEQDAVLSGGGEGEPGSIDVKSPGPEEISEIGREPGRGKGELSGGALHVKKQITE